MSRRTAPFLYGGATQGHHRFYPPGDAPPLLGGFFAGARWTFDNGWVFDRFDQEADDPLFGNAPPLELPAWDPLTDHPTEPQAIALFREQDDPNYVYAPENADLSQAAFWSKGRVSQVGDVVVIHGGVTARIPDGTTLVCDRIMVNPDGYLEIEEGGKLIAKTIVIRTGAIFVDQGEGNSVEIDNTENIDITLDPTTIGLGFLAFGNVDIQGAALPYVWALKNDVAAPATQIRLSDFDIYRDENDANDGAGLPLDIQPGDKLALGSVEAHFNQNGGKPFLGSGTEHVEVDSIDGRDITLTQGLTKGFAAYFDSAVRTHIGSNFGPPPRGGETDSSHLEWALKPLIVLLSRRKQYTVTDPDAPRHRRAVFMIFSPNAKVQWTEFPGGWGRSSQRMADGYAIEPGTEPHAATDNIWWRGAITIFRAGYQRWADFWATDENGDFINPAATVIGCSVHGDDLGDVHANGTHGGGSPSYIIGVYQSYARTDRNAGVNAIGAPWMTLSPFTAGSRQRNVFGEVWGQYPGENVREAVPKNDSGGWWYNRHGRIGEGIFDNSRMWFEKQCIVFNTKGPSIFNFSRGVPPGGGWASGETNNFNPEYAAFAPWALHNYYQQIDAGTAAGEMNETSPLLVEGHYALGCGFAPHVIRTNPFLRHDMRTRWINGLWVGCKAGAFFEYTLGYSLVNCVSVGPDPNAHDSDYFNSVVNPGAFLGNGGITCGILIGQATLGFTINNGYSRHYDAGIGTENRGTTDPDPWVEAGVTETEYFLNFALNCDSVGNIEDYHGFPVDANLTGTYDQSFGATLDSNWDDFLISEVYDLTGEFEDSLGTWPLGSRIGDNTPDYSLSASAVNALLSNPDTTVPWAGYWTDTVSGDNFVQLPLFLSNRPWGLNRLVTVPVKLGWLGNNGDYRWVDFSTGNRLPNNFRGLADFAALKTASNALLAQSTDFDPLIPS